MEIRELDNDIKSGKLKNIYFFYGPETFMIENKINSIKKRVVLQQYEDMNFSSFSGKDSSFDIFEEEFYSYPMTGEKKLILLKNTGWFQNSKSKEFEVIKKLFSDIPEYLYVIVVEENFDTKKEKNVSFITEAGGGIVNFGYLPVNQLCAWIEKMFSDNEKIVKQSDILYIANACNYEMGKIYNEVNKIIIFSDDRQTVSSRDISILVTKSAEYKIYELFDDIVESRSYQAMEKLKQILESKEKPTSVIAGITNKFSELLTLKLLNSDRVPISQMSDYLDYKIPDFVIKKMLTQSKKFGEQYLKRIIKLGIKLDSSIKNGKIAQDVAVELFVAELIKK